MEAGVGPSPCCRTVKFISKTIILIAFLPCKYSQTSSKQTENLETEHMQCPTHTGGHICRVLTEKFPGMCLLVTLVMGVSSVDQNSMLEIKKILKR